MAVFSETSGGYLLSLWETENPSKLTCLKGGLFVPFRFPFSSFLTSNILASTRCSWSSRVREIYFLHYFLILISGPESWLYDSALTSKTRTDNIKSQMWQHCLGRRIELSRVGSRRSTVLFLITLLSIKGRKGRSLGDVSRFEFPFFSYFFLWLSSEMAPSQILLLLIAGLTSIISNVEAFSNEFTVSIEPGKDECFFVPVVKDVYLEIDYQVIS